LSALGLDILYDFLGEVCSLQTLGPNQEESSPGILVASVDIRASRHHGWADTPLSPALFKYLETASTGTTTYT